MCVRHVVQCAICHAYPGNQVNSSDAEVETRHPGAFLKHSISKTMPAGLAKVWATEPFTAIRSETLVIMQPHFLHISTPFFLASRHSRFVPADLPSFFCRKPKGGEGERKNRGPHPLWAEKSLICFLFLNNRFHVIYPVFRKKSIFRHTLLLAEFLFAIECWVFNCCLEKT